MSPPRRWSRLHREAFGLHIEISDSRTIGTREQLTNELAQVGFAPEDAVEFAEHNVPAANTVHALRPPVILEAAFRFTGR